MTSVRPFRRSDRDQVAALVNLHVAAVVPGAAVSVNTLLSQLEREPGEFVVDPWVVERLTLVAEQRGRVVGAAHLLRYADDDGVAEGYRDAAEIRWLVVQPSAPYWPDAADAGEPLLTAALAQLARWRPATVWADGALPAPGVYGVPEQWPHVRRLLAAAGFTPTQPAEHVLLAAVERLREATTVRPDGLVRTVGPLGTRFAVRDGDDEVARLEVDTVLGAPGRTPFPSAADVADLWVAPDRRRQGLGTALLAAAADWLHLGGVQRLLSYVDVDDAAALGFHRAAGFTVLTRTERGWRLVPA